MMAIVENEGFSDIRGFVDPLLVIQAVHEGDIPDLVISDFNMPAFNGKTLLNNLSTMVSSFSGILVTGNVQSALNITDDYPVLDKTDPNFYELLSNAVKNSLFEKL